MWPNLCHRISSCVPCYVRGPPGPWTAWSRDRPCPWPRKTPRPAWCVCAGQGSPHGLVSCWSGQYHSCTQLWGGWATFPPAHKPPQYLYLCVRHSATTLRDSTHTLSLPWGSARATMSWQFYSYIVSPFSGRLHFIYHWGTISKELWERGKYNASEEKQIITVYT